MGLRTVVVVVAAVTLGVSGVGAVGNRAVGPVVWAQEPDGTPVPIEPAPPEPGPDVFVAPGVLWGPVDVARDQPAPVRVAAVAVDPAEAGADLGVTVQFAEGFPAPAGLWRVSVGVGDPTGTWVQSQMRWDGGSGTGEVTLFTPGDEVPDGETAAPGPDAAAEVLGPTGVEVDAEGARVRITVPAAAQQGLTGDLLWVGAELEGADGTVARQRSPWFSRSALAGQAAPGTVSGGPAGFGARPDAPTGSPDASDEVFDVGVPSVLEVVAGTLQITPGSVPATVGGQAVVSVVDIVTLSTVAGFPDAAPQVVMDLTAGTVVLGTGGFVASGSSGPGDPGVERTWLAEGLVGPVAGPVPPVIVDMTGVLDASGVAPAPGDPSIPVDSVAIRRVVTTDTEGVVNAVGVVAGRTWLAGAPGVTTTAPPAAAPALDLLAGDDDSSGVLMLVALGVLVGAVAIAASVVVASARARRRHTAPLAVPPGGISGGPPAAGLGEPVFAGVPVNPDAVADRDAPDVVDTPDTPDTLDASDLRRVEPVATLPPDIGGDGDGEVAEPDGLVTASGGDGDEPPGDGLDGGSEAQGVAVTGGADAVAPHLPSQPADREPPASGPQPVGRSQPEPLASLDDELDALAERLRRLGEP